MTKDELLKRFPRASRAFVEANAAGIPAAEPERPARKTLEHPAPGEATSRPRFAIRFDCFSRRPLDWDNWRLKDLQDMLIVAGILDDDSHELIEGGVCSHKVHAEAEERTEITIYEQTVE